MTPQLSNLWKASATKILTLESRYDFSQGAPVFTQAGEYTSRGWTDWTLGFHYGSALLQFDETGDEEFLELGRRGTLEKMVNAVTHSGVHDHGFNIVSTFGALRRLIVEGRIESNPWEESCYALALRCSAAVQASRWTETQDGGFIYSFNGPHSLFADTIRSLRVLAMGHLLGHTLLGEGDRHISLLDRLHQHARSTSKYSVYGGKGRDAYDLPGRVAHESIFNIRDGSYRCPGTQQGFSTRSTWTRGLAWIILGFAEILEFLDWYQPQHEVMQSIQIFEEAAANAANFYLQKTPSNGIPYWDTAAPGLTHIPDHLDQPADPYNDFEPVDSSAAAITAQGLLRLGKRLRKSRPEEGSKFWQAGLTVTSSLFNSPYLDQSSEHEGLILHSVYHRPNGWDYVPPGRSVPCGESSMWGDYHARELALYLGRVIRGERYYTFWSDKENPR